MIEFSLIEKKYSSLTKTRRDLLFSQQVSNLLLEMAEENGLTDKGAENLFDEVGLIILGIKDTGGFQHIIQKIVDSSSIDGVDKKECISKIVYGVKKEIFDKLNTAKTDSQETNLSNGPDKKVEGKANEITTATSKPIVPSATPDTKERLDLRPQGAVPVVPEPPKAPAAPQQGARPLTREELMNALSPKRTMAADIEAVRQKQEEKPKESFPDYEAFRKLDEEKK